ncbi:MAG: glycosyltransferase family 4 protein [Clostridiales bacterium]|nr:glycosyltransferase family 4 protein [Clostridiales bacterium]
MKVLFIATVTMHITSFHIPYLKWFKEQGWEVHVATYGDDAIPYCDKKHDLAIQRSPFRFSNIKAYFQLKKILKNEKYDIIHGHTPMGGVLTRLCGKPHKKAGTRVLYTAHGFHFCKGAPLLNWLLYYPMEKWLSRYTDALITINQEDYHLASQKMKAKKTYYIPGIGVDTAKFENPAVDRESKRKELGIPPDATVLISVGELTKRKNHQTAIKAVSKIKNDNVYYIICGQGELHESLQSLCKALGMEHRVLFLGHRTDVVDLLHMSDVFVFPSRQEGLPVALMEAMAAGLPCVASNIRGNVDLIEHGKGGFLCNVNDVGEYSRAIEEMINKRDMGTYNQTLMQKFDLAVVMRQMEAIYREQQ